VRCIYECIAIAFGLGDGRTIAHFVNDGQIVPDDFAFSSGSPSSDYDTRRMSTMSPFALARWASVPRLRPRHMCRHIEAFTSCFLACQVYVMAIVSLALSAVPQACLSTASRRFTDGRLVSPRRPRRATSARIQRARELYLTIYHGNVFSSLPKDRVREDEAKLRYDFTS